MIASALIIFLQGESLMMKLGCITTERDITILKLADLLAKIQLGLMVETLIYMVMSLMTQQTLMIQVVIDQHLFEDNLGHLIVLLIGQVLRILSLELAALVHLL